MKDGIYINLGPGKVLPKNRKSVERQDAQLQPVEADPKKAKVKQHIQDLGLENFAQDFKSIDQFYIDLSKAGKAHLPDGAERFAYKPSNEKGTIYIPVNRLKEVYQTDEALNESKVKSNMEKIKHGTPLDPIEIGYAYDVHDGHHRLEASKRLGYTHVPCVVVGTDPQKVKEAKEAYRKVWKSEDKDTLEKALDFTHLVKRQVTVHGQNGKMFTRMQWIDPRDNEPIHEERHEEDDDHKAFNKMKVDKREKAIRSWVKQDMDRAQSFAKFHGAPYMVKDLAPIMAHIRRNNLGKHIPMEQLKPHLRYQDKDMNVGGPLDLSRLNKGIPLSEHPSIHINRNEFREQGMSSDPKGYINHIFGDMSIEGLEHVFSTDKYHTELKGITLKADRPDAQANCQFTIRNTDGEMAGEIKRVFRRDPDGSFHVYNEYLDIFEEHQNSGLGSDIYERSETTWKTMAQGKDVNITTLANISVGVYAWAKKGFDFDGDHEVETCKSEFKKWCKFNNIDHDKALDDAGHAWYTRLKTAKDWANLDDGNDYDLTDVWHSPDSHYKDEPNQIATAKLGKAFLLTGKSAWSGKKILKVEE